MPDKSEKVSQYAYIHGVSDFNLSKPFVGQGTKKYFVTFPDPSPESLNGMSSFVINADQLYSAKRKDGSVIEGMYDIKFPKGRDIRVQQAIDFKDKNPETGEPVPAGHRKNGDPYYDYVKATVNMSPEQINAYIKDAREAYKAEHPEKYADKDAAAKDAKPKVREPKMPDVSEGFEL